MVLHVNEPYAPINAVTQVFVLLNNSWHLKLEEFTPLPGMQIWTLVVYAILDEEDQIVHYVGFS